MRFIINYCIACCRQASAQSDVVAGERASGRFVRGPERTKSQERAESGECGEKTSTHGLYLSGVQQQLGDAHIQRIYPRPQP